MPKKVSKSNSVSDSFGSYSAVQVPMASNISISLPSFGGSVSDNCQFFFSQFDDIARLENWTEEKKLILIKTRLTDKALQFLIDSPHLQKLKSVSEFSKAFIQKFDKQPSFANLQQQFLNINQRPDQSVSDLAETINNQAQKYLVFQNCYDPSVLNFMENVKLHRFVQALRPDIRLETKKLGPTKFDEAIKIAINIEAALQDDEETDFNNIRVTHTKTITQDDQTENSQIRNNESDKIEKLSQEVNNLKIAQSLNQRLAGSEIFCHICGKNHLTTACWYYPSNVSNFANQSFRPFPSRQYFQYHSAQNFGSQYPSFRSTRPPGHKFSANFPRTQPAQYNSRWARKNTNANTYANGDNKAHRNLN